MILHNNFSISLRSFLRLKTTHVHPRKTAVSVSNHPSITTAYSISDEDLQSRGFNLHRTIADLNLDQLNSIFVAVRFPRREPDKILLALEHTDSLLWVHYEKTQKAVAFARATGDGVFNAIIWDVVVDPSFQGIGLGKVLMERFVDELLQRGITNIALYSEPRVAFGFYCGSGWDPRNGVLQQTEKKIVKRFFV